MKDFILLQILPSLNSGGVEQGTIDLANSLKNFGYRSFVASNGGRMVPFLKKNNIKHFNVPLHSKNPFVMFLNIWRLKKIIKKNAINVIHVRSRAPAWTALFCKKNNIKLISTFHNIYGHSNIFKKKYNQGLAKSDKIIAISKFVKNSITKIYKISPKKIVVIQRGIDLNYFNSKNILEQETVKFMKKHLIPLDKKIILFPGRYSDWKGQLKFIEVISKINDKNLFFLFVGDDKNKNYLKKIHNKIELYKLGSDCRLLGMQENMPLIYKLSSIIVSAPTKPEGFGRIVTEAMAMKKFVIAYNYGGVEEQIINLPEICKVTPKDQNELIKKIKEAVNISKVKHKNITDQSYEFTTNHFDKKKMINKTINFYRSI